MITKNEKLSNARLYVVLGSESAGGRPAEAVAREAVLGGADIIQLRMKGASTGDLTRRARSVGKIVQDLGALFIVNDDVTAAIDSGADGVHIGQDDLAVTEVRRRAGFGLLIGKSTHSPAQAITASGEAVDYLGFGPMFSTPTKPDYRAIGPEQIREIDGKISKPFFAIGGISLQTAREVLRMGADRIAVVRAVQDADNVRAAAEAFKKLLTQQESRI
jgi:thiamine-phosphate pyrophosphorylase